MKLLKLSPPVYTRRARRLWTRELRRGAWATGPCVAAFESELAQLSGVPADHVVATDSCTRAIACAATLLIGTRVTTWAETFPSAYTWARDYQFKPFGTQVDVSNDLWGIQRPTGRILDAAHRWRPLEVRDRFDDGAEAVCWSFGCQKELPGLRGGAIVFRHRNDDAREWLRRRKGLLHNADAAFLLGQLPHAGRWRMRRQQVLGYYLEDTELPLVTVPWEASGHLCVLRFPDTASKAEAVGALTRAHVESSTHFPGNPLCETALSVPCWPGMRRRDVRRVARAIPCPGPR